MIITHPQMNKAPEIPLADITKKTIVSLKASDILADGQEGIQMQDPITGEIGYIRKGTVAATMANINELNRLLQRTCTTEEVQKISELCTTIKESLPSLRVLGMFRFFSPFEWMADSKQPGRTLVAIFLLQKHPEFINDELLKRLEFLKQDAPEFLVHEIAKITI